MKRPNPYRPENFQDTPMGRALEDLAKRMDEEDLPPVTINAVGGFALLLHGVRSRTCVTDIDYVGRPFSDKFNRIADEIGLAHQMGKGWINNDVMMAGISTKSFEFSTGELHFHEAFSVGNIKINVLDEKDLLRMKLIAVDTSVSGTDNGGEFTRVKDLPDVKALMDRQGVKSGDLYAKYGEWIQPSTQRVIQSYESGGEEAVYQEIDRRGKQYRDALRKQRETRADTPYRPNPYLAQFIRTAQARADAEKDWEDDEDALC